MNDLELARRTGTPSALAGQLSRRDGAMTVRLFGELDIASVPRAEALICEAEACGSMPLELDLTGVEFIDSTGLRMLLRARDRALETGRRLRVRPAPPPADRIFALTGTGRLFEFLL